MYIFLTILIIFAALLLIGIVLIQKSKGGGLASNFQSGNQILGVKSTNSFVEQATWTLAIIICVLSVLSAFVAPHNLVESKVNSVAPVEQTAPVFPSVDTPAETPAAEVAE
ncbi:MAG: preprotein translocase subunit SecG [Muribaculaceae bacterium]|nr:preprotein translocase subunit SecG [Muribaculaceae bacterium]